jgi:hypothetical protein
MMYLHPAQQREGRREGGRKEGRKEGRKASSAQLLQLEKALTPFPLLPRYEGKKRKKEERQ